jgi:hypothetical protein
MNTHDETTTTPTGTAVTDTAAGTAPEPTYLTGPAPFPIVLGLLGLLTAIGVVVADLADLTVPWTDLGPWTVVLAGVVILVVGAVGLRSSRAQD